MNKKILLNIEFTSYCYANCSMCPRHDVSELGYMSQNTVKCIRSQVSPDLFWEVNISGRGEPTLHPEFPVLLEEFKDLPVKKALVTTGVCMTPDILSAIRTSIDKVRLSISSYDPEIFSQVHRGLHYKSIWNNIEKIGAIFPEKVVCHLVGGPVIYNSLPKTVSHLRDLGFSEMYLFPLWNRAGSKEGVLSKKDRLSMLEQLQIPPSEKEYSNNNVEAFRKDFSYYSKENPQYCSIGDSSIAIGYTGDVVGCFQDFAHKAIIGNIHTHTLYDVYIHRKTMLGNMDICRLCNTKNEVIVCN